ncbi:MAG: heparinase II/III family protein [Luteolibacter sp.]
MTGISKTSGIWLACLAITAAGDFSEKPHPRLWFPKTMESAVRQRLAVDPLASKLQAAIMADAEKVLKARTCRYEIPDGKRLLAESRLAFHNVMLTAWAWRMGGGETYRQRTIAELEAACALKDWNPSHFLDTAEMATAVATGYDWLYPTLTPAQRTMCETALIEKALKPAKSVYDKGDWWSKPHNNWSQVCGGGIAIAAAAVADVNPELAGPLFTHGIELIKGCGKFYQPDGMYPEGPGYWQYGTNYHVMFLAATAALDRPVADDPILEKAGDAMMHLTSPNRLTFNFADSHASRATPSPAQCWLARQYKNAAQARYIRSLFDHAFDEGKGQITIGQWAPLLILWLPELPEPGVAQNAAVFGGEQSMALFRNGWTNDSAYLAIKGGTPAASHGHMDVGSFVYDAHGIRWINDLGSENYNLPGYFGDKRWTYYRLQNRSHNTLEIDGKLQNPKSEPCHLTRSTIRGNFYEAAFDLTDAYARTAGKVTRLAHFDAQSGATRIEDEITDPSGPVCWRAFTDADPQIKGDDVILKKDGQQITLRKISSAGHWSITDAKPPTAAENQNRGFHAIVLTAPKAEKITLSVEIRP